MKRRLSVVTSCMLLVISWPSATRAESIADWPQWRGPRADGTALQSNPPLEWGEDHNVKWKVAVPGRGSASPIVWGNRVFLLSAERTDRPAENAPDQLADATPAEERRPGRRPGRFTTRSRGMPSVYYRFLAICLDRDTGKTRWQKTAVEAVPHEGGHETNTFASASPATDGRYVYASFGSRGIFCYDMDGKLIWHRDLGDMETRNDFGEGSSPALYEDLLFVPWDQEDQSLLVALDARTGDIRWQKQRDEPTTWATPLVVEFNDRTQVVTNGTNRVRSYDAHSGELIWECGGQASNPTASPVAADGIVYCTTGHRGYAVFAMPLSARGDITGSDAVVWSRDDIGSYIGSPVLYDGRLYVTKARDGIITSLDAKTGETVIKPSRLPDIHTVYASAVAAADRVYLTGRQGVTVVIEHGDEFHILAKNQLDEGIDASPAIAGDQIFLRGEEHLYCIEEMRRSR